MIITATLKAINNAKRVEITLKNGAIVIKGYFGKNCFEINDENNKTAITEVKIPITAFPKKLNRKGEKIIISTFETEHIAINFREWQGRRKKAYIFFPENPKHSCDLITVDGRELLDVLGFFLTTSQRQEFKKVTKV